MTSTQVILMWPAAILSIGPAEPNEVHSKNSSTLDCDGAPNHTFT